MNFKVALIAITLVSMSAFSGQEVQQSNIGGAIVKGPYGLIQIVVPTLTVPGFVNPYFILADEDSGKAICNILEKTYKNCKF